MKLFTILLAVTATTGAEVPISLIPDADLGRRKFAEFKEIGWDTDSEWFHKPAPVCRATDKPLDVEPFVKIAKEFNIPPSVRYRESDPDFGLPGDGTVYFADDKTGRRYAMGNPRSRFFKVGLADFYDYERDEHNMVVVRPLPTKEVCIRIGREWLSRMGIPETEFCRDGDWPEGFRISARAHRVTGTHPETKLEAVAEFGLEVCFVQQIGGLPVFWNGFGGIVRFEIADGGEFCSASGCLRAWEKIGDYRVLNRNEITAALKEGFHWSYGPIQCDKIEITKVELEAFHSQPDRPQKDFPLVYTLHCKLHGGPENGSTRSLLMPALKQHRDKYPLHAAEKEKEAEKGDSI